MQQVLRQEHKYLLTLLQAKQLIDKLSKLLTTDTHNGTDGYLIRSLYFDTAYDNDFFDKENGIETRKKIRLRTYDCNADFAFLEMKQKQSAEQKKRSLKLSKKDALMLCSGNYSPLLNYDDAFAIECYALMNVNVYRPKTVIDYNRFAFVAKENRIRITLDSNIRATEGCFDIFSSKLALNPVFETSHVVLEVKYDGFLPTYIKDAIEQVNTSSLSVSKYCLGRSVSQRYIF